ncbi:hypothetical protein EA088_24740, partial [Salmonella enterica subsp. enterica serovar Minnesota]|nr:hypothetical protein [Salmonella enterica subsp. enterica serovar Minnesota]
NNITLNASGKADLTNATLNSSSGAVSVTAQGGDFLLGAGNISAVNDITLNASGKADLNGGTLNSSEGNISVSAVSTTSADGISLSDNGNISAANGTVTLQGSSATGAGVRVSNAAIYAQKAVISGNSSTGYGFSLTNVTLGSNLSDLTNVTLSSAGSGAGAINILDSSVVNSSNRDTLLNMTIGGMTTVDMSGTAIYENATQAWVQDYGNASAPNNGWIFSNTTVNAASADLKGVGFNHSNLTINNGSLNITNNASSSLADNNITVTNGSFSVLAKAGSLSLSGTNITANNISVQVNRGGVLLNGAVVSSAVGGVDVVAGLGDINLSTSGITANTDISLRAMSGGVDLTNGTLNSSSGAVSVTAKDGDF